MNEVQRTQLYIAIKFKFALFSSINMKLWLLIVYEMELIDQKSFKIPMVIMA